MPWRDDTDSMRHMLDHAREAIAFGGGKTPEEIDADRILSLALTRLSVMTGSAAKRITAETREKHPNIAWSDVIHTGHLLSHGYDSIDPSIVRDVIRDNLPPLVAELERILGE